MYKLVIFVFLGSSVLSIESIERTDFRNLGSHFDRNTFEKNTFEDLIVEDLLNRNLTRDDYKILTKLGLKQYFKLMSAIKENKKIVAGNHVILDELNFTKTAADSNVVFDGVRGFSAVKVENPQVNSILDSKFEVRSMIHLPQLTFFGHLVDQNKPFQFKLSEISYVVTEYKRVDDEFRAKLIQNSEEIHFNGADLSVANEKNSNKSLDQEVHQRVSRYLHDAIDFLRASTSSYWAGADNWYLRQRKDQLLDKLFKLVLKTVNTYPTLGCELPRFTFRDPKTSTSYEVVSGFLEIDSGSVRSLMKNVNENGDIEMAFPMSGSLKYYVLQLNCTAYCHFYGHRFLVTKTDVHISFVDQLIQNVQWIFEMKYAESLVDNHVLPHNEESFNKVLENVSKVVNEKFLVFLKSFLGSDFF